MSIKDQLYQNQYLSEVLRIIISRADDISILRQLSERKTGKVRLNSTLVEKVLREVEYREDQRLTKESHTISLFHGLKFCVKPQRKMLGKLARKMIRVHPQEDIELQKQPEMINSEAHLSQIMGVKYTASMANNESKKKELLLESVTKEQLPKFSRFLEAALKEPEVDVEYVLKLCVQNSRNAFCTEFKTQEMIIRECSNGISQGLGISGSNGITREGRYNRPTLMASGNGTSCNPGFLPAVNKGTSVVASTNEPGSSGVSSTTPSVRNQFQSNFNIMKRYNQTLKPDVLIFKNEKMVRMMLNNNTDVERTIRRYKESRGLDVATPSRFTNITPETSRPLNTLLPQRNRSSNPTRAMDRQNPTSCKQTPLTPLKTSATPSTSHHRPATSREPKSSSSSVSQSSFLNSNRATRKGRNAIVGNRGNGVVEANGSGQNDGGDLKKQTRRLLREGRNVRTISNAANTGTTFDFAAVTSFLDLSGNGKTGAVRCVKKDDARPLTSNGINKRPIDDVPLVRQSLQSGKSCGRLATVESSGRLNQKNSPYSVLDDNEDQGEVVDDDEDEDDDDEDEEDEEEEGDEDDAGSSEEDRSDNSDGTDENQEQIGISKPRFGLAKSRFDGCGESSPNLIVASKILLTEEEEGEFSKFQRSPKRNQTQIKATDSQCQGAIATSRVSNINKKYHASHSLPLSKASSTTNLLEGSPLKVVSIDPLKSFKPTDLTKKNFDDSEDEQRFLEEIYLTDIGYYYAILGENKGLNRRSTQAREKYTKAALVIQKDMKVRIHRIKTRRVIKLQTVVRRFLATLERRRRKVALVRQHYLQHRLKRWLLFMIKKQRMKRRSSVRLRQLWSKRRYDLQKIVKIQNFVRYYVCQKHRLRSKLEIRRYKREKAQKNRAANKLNMSSWAQSHKAAGAILSAHVSTLAMAKNCWEFLEPETKSLKGKRYPQLLQSFLDNNQPKDVDNEGDLLDSQPFYQSTRSNYLKSDQEEAVTAFDRQERHIENISCYIQFMEQQLENFSQRAIQSARNERIKVTTTDSKYV